MSLVAAGCQMSVPAPAPAPAPAPLHAPHAPAVPDDAQAEPLDPALGWPAPDGGSQPTITCMADERRWGSTCCRTEGAPGRRRWQACHGPQLGKVCHRRGDCDIACECDRAFVHHDGKTGVTGHCAGAPMSGVWTCELDEHGRVTSLIID